MDAAACSASFTMGAKLLRLNSAMQAAVGVGVADHPTC